MCSDILEICKWTSRLLKYHYPAEGQRCRDGSAAMLEDSMEVDWLILKFLIQFDLIFLNNMKFGYRVSLFYDYHISH